MGMVGKSGSKKTPVMNVICDPLREWFDKHGTPAYNLPDGVGNPVEEITTDATPEALTMDLAEHGGRGIILSDEGTILNIMAGATYGKTGGAQNVDIALQASNGGNVRCRRKGENADIRIPHAHLSILVGLQPNMLEAFTHNPYLNNRGLPQRFLFFIPETAGRCIIAELPKTSMELVEQWQKRITELAGSFRDKDLVLPLSFAAYQAHQRYAQVVEDRRGIEWGNCDAMESWASKMLGVTARIAGILTLLEDPNAKCVELIAYDHAQRMMEEYFIPHMRYAFCGERNLTDTAECVLNAMKASVTRSEKYVLESKLWDKLRKKNPFNKNDGRSKFEKAINELATAGMIRQIELEPSGTGRPVKGAWEVRPELLVNVQAAQPKKMGYELNQFFPNYDAAQPEPQTEPVTPEEDRGFPF